MTTRKQYRIESYDGISDKWNVYYNTYDSKGVADAIIEKYKKDDVLMRGSEGTYRVMERMIEIGEWTET